MTHCYSIPWHGLHSTTTFMVIAAIFSDLWLICPPSSLSSFPFSSPTTSRLPPCFPPPPLLPPAYLLLCRPQAGDDLRLLEDGLAGELLQHCHDHQAGGSGQGMFLLFPFCRVTSASRRQRWMEGTCSRGSLLSFAMYQKRCRVPRYGGGNGCRCLIMSDHLFALVAAL